MKSKVLCRARGGFAMLGSRDPADVKHVVQILLTVVVTGLLLALADKVLQPVPIPAGTAVLGGLLGLWLGREFRWVRVCLGVIIGLLPGVGAHSCMHWTGRSTLPQEGFAAHLALDGAEGLAIAVLVVGAGVLVRKGMERAAT